MTIRKSERLLLNKLQDPTPQDSKTQDGNLTRPPAAPLNKDADSNRAGDRSGGKSDCGPGEGSGCKYNKNALLGLWNQETHQDLNYTTKANNIIEHFLIHTP